MVCTSCKNWYPDRVDIKKNVAPDSADTDELDMSGTHLSSWPCRIQAIGGDETWRGRGLEGHVDYVVEGYFTSGVLETMQLFVVSGRGMFDGLTMEITSVRPKHEGTRKLELYCTA